MSLLKMGESVSPRYSVTCVEKVDAPQGSEGKNWYRYVIKAGGSTIAGCRRGTLQQVTCHAKTFADELNARSQGRGKGASTWGSRQKTT